MELAVALPILNKISEFAQDANNKIASVRSCLNAFMIIVVAILVAHFVDKAFYTYKKSSDDADQTVTYFTIALKLMLMLLIFYVLWKIRKVIIEEPTSKLNTKMWNSHICLIGFYYCMWASYETVYTAWMLDPNHQRDLTDNTLIMLAVVELIFNISSVCLMALLFRMIDKMTMIVQDEHYCPVLKRNIPFSVFINNSKLIEQHIAQNGGT